VLAIVRDMPSAPHDGLARLFSDQPTLAAQLLRECAGANVPTGLPARLEPPGFNDRPSTDFDADIVVVDGPSHNPVHATVVEAQLTKNEEKRQQLPRYAAALWLLIRCPVDVLVICLDQAVADFYAQPIRTSLPGYEMWPRVVGPAQVPHITDPAKVADSPGLGVLSVVMHGQDRAVADAFLAGLASVPPQQGSEYYETAYSMCAAAIRDVLEDLVPTSTWLVASPFAKEHFGRGLAEGKAEGLAEGKAEGLAEGKAEGLAEGKAEGEAEALLLVLQARGLEVTRADHARISGCTDLEQLRTWVARAVTISTVSDLFR
jgi:hypothetical protein